jgi:hypothetical protein
MGKPIPPTDKRYVRRSENVIPLNLSMDREAVRLLRKYASGPRGHGRFLSELVFDYDRRGEFRNLWEEARQDLKQLCRSVQKEMRRQNRDSK